MRYWLMKSEPEVFGIDDLMNRPGQTEAWDGVRNYQARNMMRDEMRVGDSVFFYHSNCALPGIVGLARITREAYPDSTDPASATAKPRWVVVDVQFVRKLARTISLTELKTWPELADMPLVRRGNRLSIMPVTPGQWNFILSLE